MAALAALLLALAAPLEIRLATPEGSGAVSLAIVEYRGGAFLNFLSFPQADGAPDGVNGSLFEHRGARVARVLAGPRLPARITLRRVYPEMAGMRRGRIRRLALLERTDGGYWHVQWDVQLQGRRACLSREAIAHFNIVVSSRSPDADGAICLNL
ncbi:MAG: hypothetical protein QOD42_2173 [Sphingomonadales bacterium]|jgi:hypothetical protein|nr:hypothetical protein [Sphingomonadales bacterium]